MIIGRQVVKVKRIYPNEKTVWDGGIGEAAKTRKERKGWVIVLEGGTGILIENEPTGLNAGDQISLTVEKLS